MYAPYFSACFDTCFSPVPLHLQLEEALVEGGILEEAVYPEEEHQRPGYLMLL